MRFQKHAGAVGREPMADERQIPATDRGTEILRYAKGDPAGPTDVLAVANETKRGEGVTGS